MDTTLQIAVPIDFDLKKIFECGQCFRWDLDTSGRYKGVAGGYPALLYTQKNVLIIESPNTSYSFWYNYFDLALDYQKIRESIAIDDYIRAASDYGTGIRILRQDKWETLCSFILSQCNNIPRIKQLIESLCRLLGDPVEFNGETFYSFPSAEAIASVTMDELSSVRAGYRIPYIWNAAQAVAAGDIDLDALSLKDPDIALRELKTLSGVGNKVANCVILFGLHMLSAFPIDVWIKKVLNEHYEKGFSASVFGPYAGIAQQYMFYYARSENNISKLVDNDNSK